MCMYIYMFMYVHVCRIYLGGIIMEGYERGSIEVKPVPYNVVLEDDTYKGQIKVGFKFTVNLSVQKDMNILCTGEDNIIMEENKCKQSTCTSIVNLWRILRWKFFLLSKRIESKNN